MNRHRLSPITIKKQSFPQPKKQQEVSIDDQIENLEDKIRRIKFNEKDQLEMKQLWNSLQDLKEAEVKIKYLNDGLIEYSNLSSGSPERNLKSPRNSQSWQFNSANRATFTLLHDSEVLKNQVNAYTHKIKQSQSAWANENMKQILENKRSLTDNINSLQKEMHEMINETKKYLSDSKFLCDEIIDKKIVETPAFQSIEVRKKQYEKVVGMMACMKRNIEDKDLRRKVNNRYEKVISTPGYKSQRNMKDSLIDAEKRETLEKFNCDLGKSNDDILKQANQLKNQIRITEILFQINESQAQHKFQINFGKLQALKSRIQGTIQNYEAWLQKLQQTISLSRPRLYLHKDAELALSYRKFNEIREKWLDLERMLIFQYCNY